MKKYLFLFAIICLAIVKTSAQNAYVFQSKYLPGRQYKAINHIEIKIVANIKGDRQFIDQLRAKGINSPLNANIVLDIQGTVITDSIKNKYFDSYLGYRIPNINISINGQKIPPPAGLINGPNEDMGLRGKMNENGRDFKIDSTDIFGKDTSKLKIGESILNPALKEVNFPTTNIKMGDSFIQNMDVNVPIDKNSFIKMQIPVTYKLISVVEGKANFETNSTVDIKFYQEKTSVNINGTAKGNMVYDMKTYFPLSKDMKFDLKMTVTNDNISIDGSADMTTSYQGSVISN